MKRIQALALVVAALCVIAPALAQDKSAGNQTDESMKVAAIDIKTLGTPTFSETKDGVTAQVWLVSRQTYKKFLSGAPAAEQDMVSQKPEVAIAVLSGEIQKEPIVKSPVELTIVSPANKASLVAMEARGEHYTHELSLIEKGTYKFSLKTMYSGKSISIEFTPAFSVL